MVAILPAFDILKAVTDPNMTSPAAIQRRAAFDVALTLAGNPEANAEIVIDGNVFERISPRLNAAHKTVFEGAFRIDKASTNLPRLSHHAGVKFLASIEKRRHPAIVLSDNLRVFSEIEGDRVAVVDSEKFIKCAKAAEEVHASGIIPDFATTITAEFFLKRKRDDC